ADVVVQVGLAATARISQPLALDAKHRAALRAFGNFQFLFPVQSRHLQLRAEGGLRNADGNRAVQIRTTALEERVLFDFEDNVQIARRPAIRPGLALAGDTQPRSRIHTGRNSQLDGFFAFETSLAVALLAALAHNLARTLARRARAGDGEKPLLVRQLAAPPACLAGLHAGALLRARAVAGLAVFLARELDFCGHPHRRFFERQRHVIAQVGAALCARASAAPAAAEQIFEAEEILENVLDVLDTGVIKH